MTRKWVAGLFVCTVIGGGGVATRTIIGQAPAQATAGEFQANVLPVLSKNCLSCHSDKARAGNLSLEAFRDPATALTQPDVWHSVLEKVESGAMPPPPAKSLSPARLGVRLSC